jgi:hypothetical protein
LTSWSSSTNGQVVSRLINAEPLTETVPPYGSEPFAFSWDDQLTVVGGQRNVELLAGLD